MMRDDQFQNLVVGDRVVRDSTHQQYRVCAVHVGEGHLFQNVVFAQVVRRDGSIGKHKYPVKRETFSLY